MNPISLKVQSIIYFLNFLLDFHMKTTNDNHSEKSTISRPENSQKLSTLGDSATQKMINHFMAKGKNVFRPKSFANSEVLLCDTKRFFFSPMLYILITIVEGTCGTTTWNFPSKMFRRMFKSHHTTATYTTRISVFSTQYFFFNFLYSAFDYQAATRESTRKKFERHLAVTWRCKVVH